MTAQEFNDWRIFPRLGMIFMSIMLVWFNFWFFGVPVTALADWHLVQYAAVISAYIGLWRFYFQTGNTTNIGNVTPPK